MITKNGECILKKSSFLFHFGNEGGICIVNDTAYNLIVDAVNFFNCTVLQPFSNPIRQNAPSVAIGFYGNMFSIKGMCAELCSTDINGAGSVAYLGFSKLSSAEMIHFHRCRGIDSLIAYENIPGYVTSSFEKSNFTRSDMSYNAIGAFTRAGYSLAYLNFMNIASKGTYFWVEYTTSISNSNFLNFHGNSNYFFHASDSTTFNTCCFFDSLIANHLTSSGHVEFINCRANVFCADQFPDGVTKISVAQTEEIEGFPLCSNIWKSCEVKIGFSKIPVVTLLFIKTK